MRAFPSVLTVAVLALALSGCGSRQSSTDAAAPTTRISASTGSPAASTAPSNAAIDLADVKQAYLDYVSAYAAVDFADASTFSPVYDLAIGDQVATDRSYFEDMQELGWRRVGVSRATRIEPRDALAAGSVELDVCVDVSAVRYFDAEGTEKVPPGDRDVLSLVVKMALTPDGDWRVSSMLPREGAPECHPSP